MTIQRLFLRPTAAEDATALAKRKKFFGKRAVQIVQTESPVTSGELLLFFSALRRLTKTA